MRKAGTMVGIMAMEITQSTRLVGVNIFRILGYIQGRNRGFRDRRLKERNFNHGLDIGQFGTVMGGMVDDITQSTGLCRRGRCRVCRGSLVLGGPLVSFPFLPEVVAIRGGSC